MINCAVVGLGSNIEPERNIAIALEHLEQNLKIIKRTQFLRIPAQGNISQPDFINGALLVETKWSLNDLKIWLKSVEQTMGRLKSMHQGFARTIDLDVHVWNSEILDQHFYQWTFLRKFIVELIPDLTYDHSQIQ